MKFGRLSFSGTRWFVVALRNRKWYAFGKSLGTTALGWHSIRAHWLCDCQLLCEYYRKLQNIYLEAQTVAKLFSFKLFFVTPSNCFSNSRMTDINSTVLYLYAVADPDQALRLGEVVVWEWGKKSSLVEIPQIFYDNRWISHKVVAFCRPRKWLFCWLSYSIFQEITTV